MRMSADGQFAARRAAREATGRSRVDSLVQDAVTRANRAVQHARCILPLREGLGFMTHAAATSGRKRKIAWAAPAWGDLFAGLTLWAVFAAQALAYSRIAHATPAAGLMTAVCGALLYALLGSSLRASMGPAGGVCAIIGASVANGPVETLAQRIAALTLLSAVFLFAAGLARISFLQRLFPVPVFVGYLAGTGVSILLGQARELASGGQLALAVGLCAIVATLALRRLAPRIPAPFVVLLTALLLSATLDLEARGVPVLGDGLGHFGSVVAPASIPLPIYRAMLLPAASLALFIYVDGLANAQALAQPGDPAIGARREYFALGGVNAVSGLFGGFVSGCSTSRSVVAIKAGARTRLAPVIAGVMLLLTGLSVVRFLGPMPLAALAGVVFVAAFDLIDTARLREFFTLRRADFWIALVSAAGVAILGPMHGVEIGVAAALAEALRRGMEPNRLVVSPGQSEHYYEPFSPSAPPIVEGLLIYRFGAPLFFANCEVFQRDMSELAQQAPRSLKTIVVNSDALGVPDASARDALRRARRALEAHGIRLAFGNARAPLRAALAKSGDFSVLDEHEFIAALETVRGVPHPSATRSH